MKNHHCSKALAVITTLCVMLAGSGLAGCGRSAPSEADVLAKLGTSGLSVEKLPRAVWTRNQRERVEQPPETVLSIRISDGAGHTQEITLLGFDAEWKANEVGPNGVPGFAVGSWFFVGEISQDIRTQIETALH